MPAEKTTYILTWNPSKWNWEDYDAAVEKTGQGEQVKQTQAGYCDLQIPPKLLGSRSPTRPRDAHQDRATAILAVRRRARS